MSTLFMEYLLQSIPAFAAYLCYANTAIRVQGQFLSDFIKEMIEAIKPTQLHTLQRHALEVYTQNMTGSGIILSRIRARRVTLVSPRPSVLVLSLTKCRNVAAKGSRAGVLWHK